jgi:hypothetical protein
MTGSERRPAQLARLRPRASVSISLRSTVTVSCAISALFTAIWPVRKRDTPETELNLRHHSVLQPRQSRRRAFLNTLIFSCFNCGSCLDVCLLLGDWGSALISASFFLHVLSERADGLSAVIIVMLYIGHSQHHIGFK